MKVIIIGAGIAGLSCGIYAQKNGMKSIIYEKNTYVGGSIIYPDSKKLEDESIVPWMGCGTTSKELYSAWNECIFLTSEDYLDVPFLFSYSDGKHSFHFFKDKEKTKQEWLELSMEDQKVISSFFSIIEDLEDYQVNAEQPWDLMGAFATTKKQLKQRKVNRILEKLENITVEEYFRSFHHPIFRQGWFSLFLPHQSVSTLFLALSFYTSGKLIFPKGGSKRIVDKMIQTYLSLGGKIIQKEVKELKIVNQNHCNGVLFSSNDTDEADAYILTPNPYYTIHHLLKGKSNDRRFLLRYENHQDYPIRSGVHIVWHIKEDLKQEGIYIFSCEPFKVARNYCSELALHIHGSLHEIYCTIHQDDLDYEYWVSLERNSFLYEKKINDLKKIIDERMKTIYTQLKDFQWKKKIQMVALYTPIQYEKATNAYKGSIYSFQITPKGKGIYHTGETDIHNVYLANQWMTSPGGMDSAFLAGKFALERLKVKMRKEIKKK